MKIYVRNPKRVRRAKYAYLKKIGCSAKDAKRLKDFSDNYFPTEVFKIEEERIEQYYKDTQIIRELKKKLPKKLFHFIAVALHESGDWTKLELIDIPTGKYQQETKDFGMWVDQYCEFEDCYSGYCYILLPDGKYIKWEYWM